jgi:K+-sensing histidine kinase KdpD
LLANLIELSRYQAKRLVLTIETLNLKNLIKKTVDKVNTMYPSHQFIVGKFLELPPVTGDPIRIERVLFNLLENAAKYSPTGSKIRILSTVTNDNIKISIIDQGEGIPYQDQGRLFLPFERLDQIRHASSKGLGIGLLVCRRLVEAHGGRIWVESSTSKGSTFAFTLPRNKTATG